MDMNIDPSDFASMKVRINKTVKKKEYLAITIPENWVKQHNIKKGDIVTFCFINKLDVKE